MIIAIYLFSIAALALVLLAITYNPFSFFVNVIATMVILYLLYSYIALADVLAHPWISALYVLSYLLVGIIYALVIGWPSFIYSKKAELQYTFKKDKPHFTEDMHSLIAYVHLNPYLHVARLASYTVAWPIYVAIDLTYKPICYAYNKLLSKLLTKITLFYVKRIVLKQQ